MGFFSSLFNTFFSSSSSPKTVSYSKSSPNKFDDDNDYYDSYPQLYSDLSDCNLNYSDYTFSGKFTKTGRMRTKRHIRIFKDEDVLYSIIKLGYEQPITYSREIPSSPSTAQLDYLYDLALDHGNSVPAVLSFYDASALISRYVDHDRIPNPELFHFADEILTIVENECYTILFSHS